MKIKKNKFKIKSKAVNKSISPRLVRVIQRKQREMQMKENIEFGRKAQNVNFQFVSDMVAKILEDKF